MKSLFAIFAMSLSLATISVAAFASTAIGVGYQGAQTNCNIQTGGYGTISNCSFNPNNTVVCACTSSHPQAQSQGYTCNSAIGVGYQGVQTNCTIQTQGKGSISNCSFNPNGTVVCSCCY